jgi:hypothetical protein
VSALDQALAHWWAHLTFSQAAAVLCALGFLACAALTWYIAVRGEE